MGIPAGMFRNRILLIKDDRNKVVTFDNLAAHPTIATHTLKAAISRVVEDTVVLGALPGQIGAGTLAFTVRKNDITKDITSSDTIYFDGNYYRPTDILPRYDDYQNLIDIKLGEL